MLTLIARYRTGEEILDAYLDTFPHGGLFYPTRKMLPVGESVVLDVRSPLITDQLIVRGEVAWSRRGKRSTGVRAGLGVQFLASEQPRCDYLLSLARGVEVAQGPRKHRRHPVEVPVGWRVPEETTTHESVLEDIGPGGTFIRTSAQHDRGTPVVIEVTPPGATGPIAIEGRVAWSRTTGGHRGMGVEFRCRDIGGYRRLREIVRRIQTAEAQP